MTTKICSKCKEEKDLKDFFPRSDQPGKFRSSCKACHRDQDRKWAAANPEKYAAANADSTRQWRARNPERAREILLKSKERHYARVLFRSVRSKAQAKGIPFDIDPEDVVIPPTCPVLGISLTQEFTEDGHRPRQDGTPSIDRIIPSKGYTKGNIAVISMRANRLKSDATLTELKAILAYIRSYGASKE
jgi:hypothetical protein